VVNKLAQSNRFHSRSFNEVLCGSDIGEILNRY
jgi:hypothetical protein